MASAYFQYFFAVRQVSPEGMEFVKQEEVSDLEETVTDDDSGSSFFEVGEPITFEGGPAWSLTYVGSFGENIVALRSNGQYYLFSNSSSLQNEPFTASATPFPACFLAGTMITTPDGEVAIETLSAGDLILTANGDAKPVRWLAKQTVSTVFADPMKVMPILVRAGALGENLPIRDLYVSADHALELDDVLVQAGALVNGTTIARHTEMPKTFVYYHIELEDHSLILAEGVPVETFVDNVTRRLFDNWQEAPDAPCAELDLPRVKSARQLSASIRERIEVRAAVISVGVAA